MSKMVIFIISDGLIDWLVA